MTQERADAVDGGQAMSVLRGIWTAQQQTAADIEAAPSSTKVCKNMKNIGFGGIAEGGADGDSTAGPVGDSLRSAWRDRLEREGKLADGATSVRDLVLGESEPRS
ncbi:MAG: hypothetical protein ACR2GH_10295 [Pseudonocardia sp.]